MCVDVSFTNATYEVNPHSRNMHLSIYQDHPKSCVNNFYEESKQEEWLRPVRKEQSLEKIVELRKDPCAVSPTFLSHRTHAKKLAIIPKRQPSRYVKSSMKRVKNIKRLKCKELKETLRPIKMKTSQSLPFKSREVIRKLQKNQRIKLFIQNRN